MPPRCGRGGGDNLEIFCDHLERRVHACASLVFGSQLTWNSLEKT